MLYAINLEKHKRKFRWFDLNLNKMKMREAWKLQWKNKEIQKQYDKLFAQARHFQ